MSSTSTTSKGWAGDGARAGASRASSGRRSGGVGDSAGGALSTGGVSSARGLVEEARGGGGAMAASLKKGVARRAGADCGTARGSRAAARSTSTKGSCELVLALLAGDGAGSGGGGGGAMPRWRSRACRSRRRWMRTFVRYWTHAPQKLQRVAQGAALSKVMEVSIVVNWWCAAPRLAFLWRRGLVSGAAATARARVRPCWPVGC